jgi:hypothetical protein
VLDGGHAERLRPGKPVGVVPKGCTPASAVARQEARLTGGNLEALRELARSSRVGIGTLRGNEEDQPAQAPRSWAAPC